jgi:hypothetical protein
MASPQNNAELDTLILRILGRAKRPLGAHKIWHRVNSKDPFVVIMHAIHRLNYKGLIRTVSIEPPPYEESLYMLYGPLERLAAI